MRDTCGGCEHLLLNDIPMDGKIFSCKKTTFVVPQSFEPVDNGWKFVFWRVPPACPLPDTKKSEEKAPMKNWITLIMERD